MDPSLLLAAAGSIMDSVGAYYEAEGAKSKLKSEALSFDFEAEMARLNSRQLEHEAYVTHDMRRREVGRLLMQAGTEASGRRVAVAAGGLAPTGSAAEVQASAKLLARVDAMERRLAAVRAAGNRMTAAVDARNQASIAALNARNARRTAQSISPLLAAGSSLLGSATRIGAEWYTDPKYPRGAR